MLSHVSVFHSVLFLNSTSLYSVPEFIHLTVDGYLHCSQLLDVEMKLL